MSNHYRIDAPADQIGFLMDADVGSDPWPGGYMAPARFGPIVTGVRQRYLRPALWGFPPPPNADGNRLITNIRNLESPFWIGTLRHPELRCLVPVTQFQEWSGEKGAKTQHWFSLPSQPLFALAGIWRDTGDMVHFAFIVTEPNALVEPIHDKGMPAILHAEDYDMWLRADWKDAQRLITPFPSQLMTVREGAV